MTKRLLAVLVAAVLLFGVAVPSLAPQRQLAAAMTLADGVSVAGDFRGAGHQQIASLYDPNDDLGLRIVLLDRTGSADTFTETQWFVSGANSFDLGRMKVAAADVDGDGRTDLVALYDDGGTSVRLLVFRSTGTGFAYAGAWWASDGYAWSRTKAVLSGSFSAVGRAGLLLVYQYDDFQMRIHYLESDGTKFIFNGNAGVYDSGPGQYDTARARFVIGRFTRTSGPDQVASLYQYDGYRIRIHVFDPSPSGLVPLGGWSGVYDSGEGMFDLGRMKVAATDVNGDGKTDVVALYGYADGSARVHFFSGSASLALTGGTQGLAYLAPGTLSWANTRLVAGDWNGDRLGDLATLSAYSDGTTHAAILRSAGSALAFTADAWITPANEIQRSACGSDCWPLTGDRYATGSMARRPLSVRIDNAPAARPHYGLSEADQVWEFLVEGFITRLNAIYHEGNPGTIGPIRSARLSDRYLTPMFRGALAYSGATIEETALIRQDARDGKYFDLDANLISSSVYYRVSSRSSPYNEFSSSDGLRLATNSVGGGAAVAVPAFGFLLKADHVATAGGFVGSGFATTLTIPYRLRSTVRYDYDAGSKTYARYQDDGAGSLVREVDASNGIAIAAKNVVIIYTDVFTADPPIVQDRLGSLGLDMRMTGTGAASIFRDGHRQDGTWSRATLNDVFTFTSLYGDTILLSPGQTWFHVVPKDWAVPSS